MSMCQLIQLRQYGVCVFRGTSLDDTSHVQLARNFGEVERLKGTPAEQSRLKSLELTDQSNLEVDGTLLDPTSMKALSNKGNELFHVDGSYNVRRTRFSMLRAYEIPPLEAGGSTGKSWGILNKFLCGQLLRESDWHSRQVAPIAPFLPLS